jgi:hypothetical protein
VQVFIRAVLYLILGSREVEGRGREGGRESCDLPPRIPLSVVGRGEFALQDQTPPALRIKGGGGD